MRRLFVCLTIAGCARAGPENVIIGGLNDARPQSNDADVPEPDASLIDAPPAQVTLSQTTSGAITPGNSFGCVNLSGATLRNSYYRVFTLADFNVTTTLHVTQVDFGIQTATAGGGAPTQPATLKLGTYGAAPQGTTLDLAQVQPITSANLQIPNGSATRMTVPITGDIPPTSRVIVELAIPSGIAAGHKFFIGTNAQGERASGYLMSADCGINPPRTMKSIADQNDFGEVDMVMTVTGLAGPPS